MSADTTTIARPYAKAVFEYAHANNQLQQWSDMLSVMAQVALNSDAIALLTNPEVSLEQQADFMLSVCASAVDEHGENFIKLLVHNKRLLVLPEIKALYEVQRAEAEKHIDVSVVSFSALNESQQQKLKASLSERLNRSVSLNIEINKDILGGAIIRAGDMVIDGSVRGKLKKLSTELVA